MAGPRLLERLRQVDHDPLSRGETELAPVLASVVGHLQKMLNTRQGSVPIAPEYGIPDFTGLATMFDPEEMPRLERIMESVIVRYEPRLTSARVRFTPDPDRPTALTFVLQAALKVEDNEAEVVFNTVLKPDGHVDIVR